jgi:hypothetical protein
MSKIKILIIVLIELGIIALSYFLDFKLPIKLGIFMLGTFVDSFILYCIIDEKYVKRFESVFYICLITVVFYIAAISIVNPHYDSKIEKYNPQQVIKLKSEILLIGNTTYISSKELKDYTLDNPKLCREKYLDVFNRKIVLDWYICE